MSMLHQQFSSCTQKKKKIYNIYAFVQTYQAVKTFQAQRQLCIHKASALNYPAVVATEKGVEVQPQNALCVAEVAFCSLPLDECLQGKTSPDFVVEVIIKPWDPYDPRNPCVGQDEHVRIQPYYADEEGNVFFRRQASIVQVR